MNELAKDYPDVEIPELSWNSGIELPYVPEPEDTTVQTKEEAKPKVVIT